MIQIPFTPDLPSFSQQIDLDGVACVMSFSWNTRDEAWYMDLAALDGTQIADGIKLVLGAELLRVTMLAGKPGGKLLVVPSVPLERIGRMDIPDNAALIYVNEGEA